MCFSIRLVLAVENLFLNMRRIFRMENAIARIAIMQSDRS